MPQGVERGDDLGNDIGDDADLAQIDAPLGQKIGDEADVLVLGAAAQDFVADDEKRRSNRLGPCKVSASGPMAKA